MAFYPHIFPRIVLTPPFFLVSLLLKVVPLFVLRLCNLMARNRLFFTGADPPSTSQVDTKRRRFLLSVMR